MMKSFYFRHLLLMLAIFTLGVSSPSHSQFGGNAFDSNNASGFSSGAQTSNPFSAPTFLRVEEAYQLTPHWQANGGESGELSLSWHIAPGYYLYKEQLQFLINGQPQPFSAPVGTVKYDEYFEKDVEVYYEALTLTLPLPANTNTQLTVRSQGCADAGLCYPPQIQTVSITPQGAELAPSLQPTPPIPSGKSSTTDNWQASLWLAAILGAVLGGLILNLMPCVFPVLSIKALSMMKTHESRERQHIHGWSYTAGCVASFVAIAGLMFSLRAGGEAIGWGFQLQSPALVGALAYLFFIMALLMLGQATWGGKFSGIGQTLTEGKSLSSSFFTGVLATIVASPCTAPFMGGALGYAVTLPTGAGLVVFAALGFGMALPFLLLSYFPGLSQRLPKPGAWMETFKQLLAFPLLLTAIWLAWVFGRQTSSDQLTLLLGGALGLSFCLWLTQQRLQSGIGKALRLALIGCTLFAAAYPLSQDSEPRTSSQQASSDETWQPYSAERLERLRADQQAVFINLTADWCITCLANEKLILSRPQVQQAFVDAGITLLKGDWTHYNAEITELLAQYGRNGVPLYLLFPADPRSEAKILPQILTESDLLVAIDKNQK